MKKQVHAYYSGRVQGVGFRFTAKDLADELGVFGWVKNSPDGGVELLAEAEEDILAGFLSKIRQCFSNCIQDLDSEYNSATGEFEGFEIRF